MKIRILLVMFSVIATLMLVAPSTIFAQKKLSFNANSTFVFDPDGTGAGFSKWLSGIGEGDANCKSNFGFLLQKNAPTSTVLAVGTEIKGLQGVVVQANETIGYDIRNDSPCTAGSPRFNIDYTLPDGTTGFSFVGGCANGTIAPSPQNPSWRRVTFNLQTQAFPAIPAGSTLQSVILIADDEGTYNLDNIMFRNLYIDKNGNAGAAPVCSF